jgi:sulfoxide reductase catalytic subunit YedY
MKRTYGQSDIRSSEITPESAWLNRRQWLKTIGLGALSAGLPAGLLAADKKRYEPVVEPASTPAWLRDKIASRTAYDSIVTESVTPYSTVSRYNNFYEFGFDKSDPAEFEDRFRAHPWTVAVGGLVDKPGRYQLEDFLKPHQLEDRIYRFRCVEAWSMVVPWLGFPLKSLIERAQPRSNAKYVAFTTLKDPEQFPEQKGDAMPWPYVEGLRLDEAMHPLTLMAVGVYGRSLPAQNGAPLRLVVPWKYGFKSIKSIVSIDFVEREPPTTWNRLAADEYGFYANVNPAVDHPRWSQKRERRLPGSVFNPNWVETKPFNGYADQVASLYTGMDLARQY